MKTKNLLTKLLLAVMSVCLLLAGVITLGLNNSNTQTATATTAPAYLTFSSESSFSLRTSKYSKMWDGTLEYSTDTTTWSTWDGSTINSSAEGKLYLRGTGNTIITGNNTVASFVLEGSKISCSGNIETLLDYATVEQGNHPAMADYAFYYLFDESYALISAPELPATTLAEGCYYAMFKKCINLKTAPEILPATTLTEHCYDSMFWECTSLKTAPELPATTLESYCYNYMFLGCTSLKTAPELPATTLANGCYSYMFAKCASLETAPELPATTLANGCYYYMFSQCDSLKIEPKLPAKTLVYKCYQSMFDGCISLETAPELPATTLAESCYNRMFGNCVALTELPELPATTLAESCYEYMFDGCTSIKISETKVDNYTKEWKIPAKETTAKYWNASMFSSTGGTFTGAPKLNTTYYLAETPHTHDSATFTEWTATDSLPTTAGNYCLENNVSITSAWTIPAGETYLCLNGHTINLSKNIVIGSGNALNIYDCGTTGAIKGNYSSLPLISNSGTLNVFGGTIINSSSEDLAIVLRNESVGIASISGGKINNSTTESGSSFGIYNLGSTNISGTADVYGKQYGVHNVKTLNISGGNVSGDEFAINNYEQSSSKTTISGGAVSSAKGRAINIQLTSTVTITGGTIHAYRVALYTAGKLHISGGTITSDTRSAIYCGQQSETYLSGEPVISGVEYEDVEEYSDIYWEYWSSIAGKIYAHNSENTTAYSGEALTLYVDNNDSASGSILVYDVEQSNKEKFILNNSAYALTLATGANNLVIAIPPHTHEGVDGEFTELTAWSQLETNGKYYLGDTIPAVSEDITIASGVEITLCLNGKTLDLGDYSIINNGALTICDCSSGANGKITGGDVVIENNGSVIVNGGTLHQNGSSQSAIDNNADTATTTVNGGTIKSQQGEAIYGKGEITVNGGLVESLSTSTCHAINFSGKLTITGGTIRANYGSAITVNSDEAVADIKNCEIISTNGNGIWNFNKLTISGTTSITAYEYGIHINNSEDTCNISENVSIVVSGSNESGVCGIYNKGTLTITGGSVICNDTYKSSAGIYNSGTATLENVTVSGQYGVYSSSSSSEITVGDNAQITADKRDGIYSYGTVNINGGTVITNSSGASYSAINTYGANGKVNITKGTIKSATTGYATGIKANSGASVIINPVNDEDVEITSGSYCVLPWETSTASVSGGTFIGYKYSAVSVGSDCTGGMTISGGVFETKSKSYASVSAAGVLTLAGGTFISNGGKTLQINADSTSTSYKSKVKISGDVSLPNGIEFKNSIGKNYDGEYILDLSDYTGNAVSVTLTSSVLSEGALVCKGSVDKLTLANSGWILKASETQGEVVLHQHSYTTVNYDQTHHWNECSCGEKSDITPHTAQADDGTCLTEVKCSCGRVVLEAQQNHVYAYTVNGAVITEKCSNAGCTAHEETATILAPTGTLTYDGVTEFEATVIYSSEWKASKNLEIIYKRSNTETDDLITSGSISASITIDTDKTATVSYSIEKAIVSVPTISSKVYTGVNLKADVAQSSLYTVQTNAGGIIVGEYDVILQLTDSDNYKWANTESATLTVKFSITKATNSFTTIPNISGWTYGQTASEPTGKATFGTVVYIYYNSEYSQISKPTSAGSYFMKASVVADGNNYDLITTDFIAFTIAKANSSLEFDSGLTLDRTYNGNASSITSSDYSLVGDGQVVITWYLDNNGVKGNALSDAPINAGTYWLGVKANEGANYNSASEITKKFVIAKAQIAKPDKNNNTFTYNGSAQTYAIAQNSLYKIENNVQTNANAYTVKVVLLDKNNYEWAGGSTNDLTFDFIIKKQQVAKPIQDTTVFTYNGNVQTYAVASDARYTVSGTTRTDAGSQNVIISLKNTANYEWVGGTVSNLNYSFVINKANAVITVDTTDIIKTYGEAWELPTATSNFGTVVCDKVVGELVNANTYAVTYTVVGTSNFNGDVKTVKVIINKATFDMSGITFIDKTVVENGEQFSLAINGTLPEGVSVEYVNNSQTKAGVYEITAKFNYDTANYNALADMTATLTVNQAQIIDHIGEEATTEPPHVEVTIDGGFAPNVDIVVTEVLESNIKASGLVGAFDKIGAVYDVAMQADGTEVQPDGQIIVKLLIPTELAEKEFRIIRNYNGEFSEIEYAVQDGYAVFTVDSLAEFSLVYYQFPWWIVVIAVAVVIAGVIVPIVIYKKKAKRKA